MEAQQAKDQNPRAAILDEAKGIVLKDRNSVYGNPEDNFGDIANLWTAYLKGRQYPIGDKNPITKMDVVVMNILIKIARLKVTPSYHDGLVDIAGYAACGGDIQKTLREYEALRKQQLSGNLGMQAAGPGIQGLMNQVQGYNQNAG